LHSDITGEIPFNFDNIKNNYVYLPIGWEWSSIDWKIDKSGRYGYCDNDGWSYSTSFETLIELSKLRQLSNDKSSLSVARRRRWFRTRICIATHLVNKLSVLVDWVCTVRSRIEDVINYNERMIIMLSAFRNKRKVYFDSILQKSEKSLKDTIAHLITIFQKLEGMKLYLKERGEIESSYSKKLELLSSKWIDAGNKDMSTKQEEPPTFASSSRFKPPILTEDELREEGTAVDVKHDGKNEQNKSGFFYVVSKCSEVIAKRTSDFSTLLTEGLPRGKFCMTSCV